MGKVVKIAQGDTLLSIAHANGIVNWTRIWEHAKNADLRKKRPNPQALHPGDLLYIPDKNEEQKEQDSPTAQQHNFQVGTPPCWFSVALKNECGEPYVGHKYRLLLGDKTFTGTTDANGFLSHPAAPDVKTGELTFWRSKENPDDTAVWTLEVGHLNPMETVSGVKDRLRNLGYNVGPIGEEMDEVTQNALKAFQMHMGRNSATGELDGETRNALFLAANSY